MSSHVAPYPSGRARPTGAPHPLLRAGSGPAGCTQVGLWVFGENFPAASDPPAEQIFSLLTAATGLAAFALILALVEQVLSLLSFC